MKLLILIISFAFANQVFAESWYAVGTNGAIGSFDKKDKCIQVESGKSGFQGCFDIFGKHDLRRWKVGQVNDLLNPNPDGTFQQKADLVLDAAGILAANAEDKDIKDEKDLRATKRGERLTGKDACVAAVNAGVTLTQPEIKNCIEVLVKEMYEADIPVDQL